MRVLKYYVKIKHYLGHENKVNENKVLSYCEALRYVWNNKEISLLVAEGLIVSMYQYAVLIQISRSQENNRVSATITMQIPLGL